MAIFLWSVNAQRVCQVAKYIVFNLQNYQLIPLTIQLLPLTKGFKGDYPFSCPVNLGKFELMQ